jgi:hypothetical protein
MYEETHAFGETDNSILGTVIVNVVTADTSGIVALADHADILVSRTFVAAEDDPSTGLSHIRDGGGGSPLSYLLAHDQAIRRSTLTIRRVAGTLEFEACTSNEQSPWKHGLVQSLLAGTAYTLVAAERTRAK